MRQLSNKNIRALQNKYHSLNLEALPKYYNNGMFRMETKNPHSLPKLQEGQKAHDCKHAYFNRFTLYMMWKGTTLITHVEQYPGVFRHISLWVKQTGSKMVPDGVFGT